MGSPLTSWRTRITLVAVLCGLVGALALRAFAEDAEQARVRVFSPRSEPFDKPFRQWTAEWWQFALTLPASDNPLLDDTGQKCYTGQRGPVWFLVGNLSGGQVTRTCEIPRNKAIFFPVANSLCSDFIVEHRTLPQLRECAATPVEALTAAAVTVDGEPVPEVFERFRVRSKVFDFTLPDGNLFDVPAGTLLSPAVDDGIYVMLRPLPVGQHTLRFTAQRPGFSIDITYHLTIVPVDLQGR